MDRHCLRKETRVGERKTVALDDRLDTVNLAAYTGLSMKSVYNYHSDGRLPPADGYEGQAPWWYRATIDAWMNAHNRWQGRLPREPRRGRSPRIATKGRYRPD